LGRPGYVDLIPRAVVSRTKIYDNKDPQLKIRQYFAIMRLKSSLFSLILPIVPFLLPLRAQAFLPEHLTQLLKTNQCPNCDLSGANLETANLANANLMGTNLSSANLTGANLSNANLEGANAKGASLNDAYLYRANLTGTNFSNASLQKANLRETLLVGTNFSNADLRSVDLQGNILAQAMFPSANLAGANLSNTIGVATIYVRTGVRASTFTEFIPQLICPASEPGEYSNLNDLTQSAKSMGFKIQTADFTGVNFAGVNLQNSLLMNANLRQVDLTGANLRSSCLIAVNFTNAKLDKADLKNIRLIATELPDRVSKDQIAARPQLTPIPSTGFYAKQTVDMMNRAQQAYYLENDRFAITQQELGIEIPPDNQVYKYRLFFAPNRYPVIMNVGLPQRDDLVTFVGFVRMKKSEQFEPATITTLCVSDKPAAPLPRWSEIDYKDRKNNRDPIACPSGFTPMK
jgi:uncharacterized protein YjbI with pentapeptide repeats